MSQNSWEQTPHTAADDRTVPLNPQQVQAGNANQYAAPSAGGAAAGEGAPASYPPYNQPYTHQNQTNVEKKGKHTTKTVLAATALAALLGGGVGGGLVAATSTGPASTISSLSSGTTIVNNTDSVNAVTAAAAKATPSTVTISATASNASGSGSGVILDTQGHVLTNTHVVTLDGASANATIEVQLADGSVHTATVVGTDPASDLAVIKIDDAAGLNLTPATLGNSDNLNVGDTTVAIGAPLGLSNTVTTGVVSNLVRTIEVASSAAQQGTDTGSGSNDTFGTSPFQFEIPGQQSQTDAQAATISLNVIQTDAAVNPGNSGGALVNSAGEVIGINVAIASTDTSSSSTSGNIGVGFAIPINYAQRVANEIIENGSATHGLLGAQVSTSPANNDESQAFGDGALIQEVTSGGAAEKAGLRAGDVVTAVNGRTISEATELTAAVRQATAGSDVTLTVLRGSSTQEVTVTLDAAES